MSRMIECDGCKKKMYEDSRTEKGGYHEIWIDRESSCHLCVHCFEGMMARVFHMHYDDEEEQYVDDHGWSECEHHEVLDSNPEIVHSLHVDPDWYCADGERILDNSDMVGIWEPLGHRIGFCKHPWSEDYRCSLCGYEAYTVLSEPPEICPECNAKMKKSGN